MSRLLLNFSLFCLGLLLACIFTYRHRLGTLVGTVLPVQAANPTHSPEEAAAPELPDYQRVQRQLMERHVTVDERLEVLSGALAEGTIDSLQLIRTEYLHFLPEYRERLLPVLKQRALENLLLRFTEQDWMNWTESAVADGSGPTEARLYVDDISLMNGELGRYLETAAQLYHGLYLTMMSGHPYALEQDLYAVIQNAETLLKHRRYTAVPARMLLDPSIVKDELFLRSLEDMRGRLWLLYQERWPKELAAQVQLLDGLKPELSARAVAEGVRSLLYRLSLQATPRLRAEMAPVLAESPAMQLFATTDDNVRQALAELYVISAVDALEADQTDRARRLLALSESTMSGLEAQTVVRRFLEAPAPKTLPAQAEAAPEEEGEAAEEAGIASLLEDGAIVDRHGLERMLVIAVILLVGAAAGFRFFLAYLARRNLEAAGDEDDVSAGLLTDEPVEDDDEIEFNDFEPLEDEALEEEPLKKEAVG